MLWSSSVLFRKNIEQHSHNVHEMIICLTGSVNIQLNDEYYSLSPGHSVFIPAQYSHAINVVKSAETTLLFACIDLPTFDSLSTPTNRLFLNTISTGKFLINNTSKSVNNNTNTLLAAAKELVNIPQSASPLHASLKEAVFLKLLFTHMSGAGYEENANELASLRISKAQNWINSNYALDITLEMVAKQVNMSRSHFARQFRQHSGFSVIDYLLKVRCDAVANLLASSNADITEIAFSAGFSNLSHFYRHFKRRYGITPRAFRQMNNHQDITIINKLA